MCSMELVTVGHLSSDCVIRCSRVSVTAIKTHAQRHINATFISMISGCSLGSFKQSNALSDVKESWTEK
jgi:hypothetical protein